MGKPGAELEEQQIVIMSCTKKGVIICQLQIDNGKKCHVLKVVFINALAFWAQKLRLRMRSVDSVDIFISLL